jgi:DNA mismatch endonuclease, patch repair protein
MKTKPGKGLKILQNGIGMSQIGPSHNTRPERVVRMCLVKLGVNFECQAKLPHMPRRTADFRVGCTYIFVNGRFWHDPKGKTKQMSKFWRDKVKGNRRRQRQTRRLLRRLGYRTRVIWCDDLRKAPLQKVERALRWTSY